MTSAIPGATDTLVGLASQSVRSVAGALAVDGWSDQRSPVMFGVGALAPPFFGAEQQGETQGSPKWVGLGLVSLEEDFVIPCYIYVGQGGTNNSAVRSQAFAIWDVFMPLVKADPTLGGVLKQGRIATVESFAARGPRNAEEAEGGRYCLIQFGVHCQNLTT